MGDEALVRLLGAGERGDAEVLRERYRGTLVGLAVGNALGGPVEGWRAADIRARHPGGVRDIPPEEAGLPWDDDLAQAALLAEALLDGDLRADDLARRLVAWWRESGRGIGVLTSQVMQELSRGTPADRAAREVWERSGRKAAGNGAVMRCAPVALRWRGRPREMIHQARASATVTHHDPRCEWSTAATVSVVATALEGRPVPEDELARAVTEAGAPPEVAEAIAAAADVEPADLALDDDDMGYTLKAMQVGLWAARQPEVQEALVAVVAAGGDTDTNAAVAGAVLGARHGVAAIPKRWIERVPRTDRLIELADALASQDRSS